MAKKHEEKEDLKDRTTNHLIIALKNDFSSKIVKILLEDGACVNAKLDDGTTPLMVALRGEVTTESVKLLLDHGACVNATHTEGVTPLMLAVKKENVEAVNMLVRYGAHINDVTKNGFSALMKSVMMRKIGPIKALLSHGADVNIKSEYGSTALSLATLGVNREPKDLEIATHLLEHGASTEDMDNGGNTLLIHAVTNCLNPFNSTAKEIVKFLVEHGATINARNNQGVTPLMLAVKKENVEAVNMLVRYGAHINDVTKNVFSALMKSVMMRTIGPIKALLSHGADVNIKSKYGSTALSLATLGVNREPKDLEIATHLLEHGASTEDMDNGGNTLLIHAVKNCLNPFNSTAKEIVKFLVEHGATINARNNRGKTALMYAASLARSTSTKGLDIVKLLLQHKASLDLKDWRGNTALMYATQGCYYFQHEVSLDIKEWRRNKALMYAIQSCYETQYRASLDLEEWRRNTALMYAIQGFYEIDNDSNPFMEMLPPFLKNVVHSEKKTLFADLKFSIRPFRPLDLFSPTQNKENNESIPLMHAVRYENCGNLKVIELLLSRGAAVNSKNQDGKIPLMVAVEAACIKPRNPVCLKIVQLLLQHGAVLEACDTDGRTPLMVIAENRQLVAELVKAGPDVLDQTDGFGYTTIMRLIGTNNCNIMPSLKLLIHCGANVDAVANKEITAMILAARRGDIPCMKILLEKSSHSLDFKDPSGFTACMHLLGRNDVFKSTRDMVFKLLECGASVNIESIYGDTPLSLVLRRFHGRSSTLHPMEENVEEIIIKLLDLEADASSLKVQEHMNYMVATKKNRIVQKMLLNGCPPRRFTCSVHHRQTVSLRSPLEVALLSKNFDVFRYFLAIRYLTWEDIFHFHNGFAKLFSEYEVLYPEQSGTKIQTLKGIVQSLSCPPPLDLQTLSLLAVTREVNKIKASCSTRNVASQSRETSSGNSQLVSSRSRGTENSSCKVARKRKLDLLPLPEPIKERLLFKTEDALIDFRSWHTLGNTNDIERDDDSDDGASVSSLLTYRDDSYQPFQSPSTLYSLSPSPGSSRRSFQSPSTLYSLSPSPGSSRRSLPSTPSSHSPAC